MPSTMAPSNGLIWSGCYCTKHDQYQLDNLPACAVSDLQCLQPRHMMRLNVPDHSKEYTVVCLDSIINFIQM